jgi:transposase-like protein
MLGKPATDDLPFPTSLPDFQRLFPDEAACIDYLAKIRWPHGFACSACGVFEEPQRIATRPKVFRCPGCEHDFSVTAGTVMDHTHTPIATWFWAAYLVSSMTPGMSAVQFQRQLGLKRYETAFQILHKLRAAMVRPERDRIGTKFPVEVDETWVGGKTRGKGRGVHHKTLVIGAVRGSGGKTWPRPRGSEPVRTNARTGVRTKRRHPSDEAA